MDVSPRRKAAGVPDARTDTEGHTDLCADGHATRRGGADTETDASADARRRTASGIDGQATGAARVAMEAGLKAGGKTLAWALVFAGLDYYVHKRLADELDQSGDMERKGSMRWARRVRAKDPAKPVYLTIIVRSDEHSQYIPLLGWMPVAPQLFLAGIEVSDRNVSIRRPSSSRTRAWTFGDLARRQK
ncbi:MAG: hypothetical protein M3O70_04520 [Actinomycetota bacterium]|nr:hypothetical protein [Actinomycetota bacterium]